MNESNCHNSDQPQLEDNEMEIIVDDGNPGHTCSHCSEDCLEDQVSISSLECHADDLEDDSMVYELVESDEATQHICDDVLCTHPLSTIAGSHNPSTVVNPQDEHMSVDFSNNILSEHNYACTAAVDQLRLELDHFHVS